MYSYDILSYCLSLVFVGVQAVREAKRAPSGPAGVASAEVESLVDSKKLGDLVLRKVNDLEVGFNAGRGNRLGEDVDVVPVGLEGDEDVGRMDAVLVSDLLDNLILEKGRVVGAEGRVSSNGDALALAKVDDVLLGASATRLSIYRRFNTTTT